MSRELVGDVAIPVLVVPGCHASSQCVFYSRDGSSPRSLAA